MAGGFLRSLVWDQLQGHEVPTPTDDVDVVFFSDASVDRELETSIAQRLHARHPNVRWDVKNQARMVDPGAAAPTSLEDSMRRWPDRASAVAARLVGDDVVVLAPLGLADLLEMRLLPNPAGSLTRFEERLRKKEWSSTWPKVVTWDDLEKGDRQPATGVLGQ